MPGGFRKINEYNKSLTQEQRKQNASRASKAGYKKKNTLKQIARIINEAPAQKEAKESLRKLGLEDESMTNAALIVAAVFKAAFEGDMKAVEKWEKYIGQFEPVTGGGGDTAEIKISLNWDGMETSGQDAGNKD